MSLSNVFRSRSPFRIAELSQYMTVDEALLTADSRIPSTATRKDLDVLYDWERRLFAPESSGKLVPTKEVLSWCFEHLWASRVFPASLHPRVLLVTEQYMRRFEIEKELKAAYDINSFLQKAVECLDKEGYSLFSGVLFLAYLETKDLRFINTLLKIRRGSPIALLRTQKIVESL